MKKLPQALKVMHDFQESVRQVQAMAGSSSDDFKQLREDILKMADDMKPGTSARDTQFSGFAKLLFAELDGLNTVWLDKQTEQYYETIIAQRAYDFLLHAAHSTSLLDTWEESKTKVALVPDLTAWTTEQGEEGKSPSAKASEQVYNIFTGDVTLMSQVAGMALDTPIITEQPYVSVFDMTEKELEEYADAMRVNALAEMEEEETK